MKGRRKKMILKQRVFKLVVIMFACCNGETTYCPRKIVQE